MARYTADYYGDNGESYAFIVSDIYRVTASAGIRGERDYTTYGEDAELIPPSILQGLTPLPPRGAGCTLPFIPRFLILWTGQSTYIHCPFPYLPGSGIANTVLEELKTIYSANFVDFGLKGEFINDSYLYWYVTNG